MTSPFQVCETSGCFEVVRPVSSEEILAMAMRLIRRRFRRGQTITSPQVACDFLVLELALLEQEVFYGVFLDNQNRLLAAECCFRGTLASSSVYPREIVKRALQLNAAAVIFAHNHPSGVSEPSVADKAITGRLVEALNLIEVRVLDHFIIGGTCCFSFAEHQLL